MPKTCFYVQPIRSDGFKFVPCEIQRATFFAVMREDSASYRGKPIKATRIIAKYSKKSEAQSMADLNNQRFAPTPAHLVRKLGRRIVKQ